MSSPSPGSTLTSSSATFQWSAATGASQYFLYVGKSANSWEYAYQNAATNLSAAVSGLPTDGSSIYVTLWTLAGSWQHNDYTYYACSGCGGGSTKAVMSNPAPGSTFTSNSTTFQWSAATGASQYFLYVGKSANSWEYAYQNAATNLSAAVSGLPTDGSSIYVTLWTLAGSWQHNDYTYYACSGCGGGSTKAVMSNPSPGSTLTSSSTTFQWSAATVASQYFLYVGKSANSWEYAYQNAATNLSAAVSGLPTDGSSIYVTLWTLAGSWQHNDYTYYACSGCGGGSTKAVMSNPAPGSTFTSNSTTFQWSAATGASQYFLYVGKSANSWEYAYQNAATNLSAAVSGLPTDGSSIYVTLWTLAGSWQHNDYTYYACSGCGGGSTKAVMSNPSPGSTLTSSSTTFQWSAATVASQYFLYVGKSANSWEYAYQNAATNLSAAVSGLPTDGSSIYVTLWTLAGSWQHNDYTYYACSGCGGGSTKAVMSNPAPGSTFTSNSTTFQWSAATGASQYFLYVGKSYGTWEYAYQNAGTNLSAAVTSLPRSEERRVGKECRSR